MSTIELVKIGTDEVQVMRDRDGSGWLPLTPACEMLGVDGRGQRERLNRAPWSYLATKEATGADGKQRELVCLRADRVAMWLATIDTSRLANDEARAKLVMWQCEAADVLDRWARGAEHMRPAALPDEWQRLAGKVEAMSRVIDRLIERRSDERTEQHEERCTQPRMIERTGWSRAKFYRVMRKHPDIAVRNKRGPMWLVDRTLRDLEARGLYRWSDKERVTGPEMTLAIQHRGLVTEDDISTAELVWLMCGCHSGLLSVTDRAVLAIFAAMPGRIGHGAMTVMLNMSGESTRLHIARLRELGYLQVKDYGIGKPKEYIPDRELMLGHRKDCTLTEQNTKAGLSALKTIAETLFPKDVLQ